MRHNTLCKKGLPSCSADAPKTTIDGRNWQLDGLRALSITGVLINHFWADQIWPTSNLYVVEPGYLGVRLFFVLSGYLITGILLRCRSSMEAGQSDAATNLRRFYIRRFLRIFPPYYALLALMFMANFPGVRNTLCGMRAMHRTSFLLSKAIGTPGSQLTSGAWRSRSNSISFGRS